MNDYDHDGTNTDVCQALLLALEWLPDMRDLVSVSLTNKTLQSLVPQAEHLWKPFREAISGSFALHDHIDTSDWDDPSVPPCDTNFAAYPDRYNYLMPRRFHLCDLKIPPRCHAGPRHAESQREHYPPHPDDLAAGHHPQTLVLDRDFLHQINEHGQLEDSFHDAAGGGAEDNISVWIPRTFPCECQCCRVVLQDQKSLIQHCLTYNHQDNAKKDDSLGFQYDDMFDRVPLEFVDPRHDPSYSSLSEFQKVRQLVQYRTKVLVALGAPMDDEELANMDRLLDAINDELISSLQEEYAFRDDSSVLPQSPFLERAGAFLRQPQQDAWEWVIYACIDESVESFRRDGMAFGCLDVIVNGRAGYLPSRISGCESYLGKWENFFMKVVLWGERRNDS
jgi:hypothetical protein